MVEKQGQTPDAAANAAPPTQGSARIDWLAREMDYRSGMTPGDMAARYGVTTERAARWSRERGWRAPLSSVEHRAKLLTAEIAAAERALAEGDFAAAEKRLRAAMAIEKAVRALADIKRETRIKGMDIKDDADAQTSDAPEGGYKAELERRLLRIVEAVERKERNIGADDAAEGS